MKKNDIALVVLIAAVSLIASYFIVSAIFMQNKKNEARVKTISAIDNKVPEPSKSIFSDKSINPAVKVTIGEDKK